MKPGRMFFSETEVNITYNNFLNTYLRIFYARFPMVKVKISRSTKPWITKGINISCLNKRNLYLNCRNSNNVDLKNHYKWYCQVLSKLITTAKNLHYNNLISQAENKQKVTWNIINTLTNQKTSNDNDPPNVNGNSSTDIANAFNTYFISVADNLLTKIFLKQLLHIMMIQWGICDNFKRCHSQIKLYNTTTYEINRIINSQKNKTSHGCDGISDKILKASSPFIISPLTYI